MENDEKTLLMQFAYRLANYHKVQQAELIGFENKQNLLDAIRKVDREGYLVLNDFI